MFLKGTCFKVPSIYGMIVLTKSIHLWPYQYLSIQLRLESSGT